MPTLNVEAPPSLLETMVSFRLQAQTGSSPAANGLVAPVLILLIAALAISVYGYHPYSEDAGIYIAGIKQAAHPSMYGSSGAFVTALSHLSRFCSLNVMLERLRVPLDHQLLALQIFTTWLLLFACWNLARQCFRGAEARWCAVCLVAVCLSVPVAGTSLFLMDPYVTGRSFSTPLSLLAIEACLSGKAPRSALLLFLAGLFHPLMAMYAAGFLLLLSAEQQRPATKTARVIQIAALIAFALAAGAAIQFSQRAVDESPAYRAAVATRTYYFLAHWHWYELLGAAAPLLLLAVYAFWRRQDSALTSGVLLARTCVTTGITATAVSLFFARPPSQSHIIAALQPMRSFLLIYLCMFFLLGGVLGELWLKRVPWRWILLFGSVAAGVIFVQNRTYPGSAHLELPGSINRNPWNQAFLWVRSNTPRDAVFALDADYIYAPEENTQGFRAIAERGSLADYSKDGGVAAAFPHLAERWQTEHLAVTGLNTIDDAERRRRLIPLHVSWLVLDRQAVTAMPCPFQNDLVKICQLL